MAKLSDGLIQRFLAATHDKHVDKKEKTYYGTISSGGVILDGSDRVTPLIKNETEVKDGDRVSVMIKDHTAVVTGNFTKPATNEEAVDDAIDEKIDEFSQVIEDELSGYSSRINQNASNINLAITKANTAQSTAENAQSAADSAQGTANSAATSAWNATQALGYKLDKGDVVTELNISTDGVKIVGNRFEVYADNCAIDAQGNAAFYQAQFPGGIKIGDSTRTNQAVTYTDKYGNAVTQYMCGGASGAATLVCNGGRVYMIPGNTSTPGYLAITSDITSAVQGLASESYVDNKCSGFATTSDLASKSDVGHTHTAENVFSYGTAATQYWVQQNFEAKSSDIRLKKNIESMSIDRVRKFYQSLNPVSYNFKKNPSKKCFGLIAQDVLSKAEKNLYLEESELDLVNRNTEISDEDKEIVNDDFYYTINYNQLHAFHIAMIQDLMKRVEVLENEVKKLKEKE